MRKSNRVRVHHEKKSDGARVDHGILLVSTWRTYFHKIFAMKTVLKAF